MWKGFSRVIILHTMSSVLIKIWLEPRIISN
jgi:hypothetical protein